MKPALFSLAAAGLVAGQSIAGIPECAIKCLTQTLPEIGCKDLTDPKCVCGSLNKIMSTASGCFSGACSREELEQAEDKALKLCRNVVSTMPSSLSIPESTSTDKTGSETSHDATATDAKATQTDDGNNDGEDAAAKPAIGLAAAAIAVIAAL